MTPFSVHDDTGNNISDHVPGVSHGRWWRWFRDTPEACKIRDLSSSSAFPIVSPPEITRAVKVHLPMSKMDTLEDSKWIEGSVVHLVGFPEFLVNIMI